MKKSNLLLILVSVVVVVLLITVSDKKVIDPVYEATGWTKEQFVEWAYEVQPIKEHKKWKQYREEEPKEMEPNEPYACVIMNDANDVPFAPMYWEEYSFELPPPYEDLPLPVRKVLECFDKNDVGKNIGDVFPAAAKPLILCYFIEGELVTSEPLSVRLLSLSKDRLSFRVAHEPFSVSLVEGIKADDRVVFYTELAPNGKETKIGIRARNGKEAYHEKE